MAYIPENGKGRLFDRQADKNKQSEPDYVGSAVVNGVHVRISAWHYPPSERQRVGTLSLAIEDHGEWEEKRRQAKLAKGTQAAKDHGQPVGRSIPGGATGDGDYDDDIPF